MTHVTYDVLNHGFGTRFVVQNRVFSHYDNSLVGFSIIDTEYERNADDIALADLIIITHEMDFEDVARHIARANYTFENDHVHDVFVDMLMELGA